MTIHDKRMPLEPEPSDAGRWVVDGQTENGAPRVRLHEPLTDPPGIDRFLPHWATCPHAERHRRKQTR